MKLLIKKLITRIAKEAKPELKDMANTETLATIEYMSPESLNHSVYYKESDIYSFGILAYELISEKDAFKMDGYKLIDAIVNHKHRPVLEDHMCSNELKAVIEHCWRDNWKERCTFDDICKRLILIREQIVFRKNTKSL